MNYTLHQLQVFLKVAENKSITRAAEELNLTQPAVSIQLRNFQDQFDIPLTEVVGRQLYVTDFGHEIEEAAREIVKRAEDIQHRTLAYRGFLTGKIKISVASTGKYVMPYFLQDFFREHPGIELAMDVTNKSRVTESLQRNEVDLALVSIPPDRLKLEHLDLISNKLFLVSHPEAKHPASKSPAKIFNGLPLIHREPGSGTRQAMEEFMEKLNLPPERKLELTSNEAVKQAVMAGLGSSIMPLIGIRNELQLGQLQIIPVKGLPVITTWQLIWLKGKRHTPATKKLLEHLAESKPSLIEKYFGWYERY